MDGDKPRPSDMTPTVLDPLVLVALGTTILFRVRPQTGLVQQGSSRADRLVRIDQADRADRRTGGRAISGYGARRLQS